MVVQLTARQTQILTRVVEEYVASGQPVGSRRLVESAGMPVSSSTVRSELAELEARGLLTHPHTSAGRIPTEQGYRLYAASLLERTDPRPATFALDLTGVRAEIEGALQATTEMLSQVTRLLALVSAPPLGTANVRRVEVLLLQPQVVMAVVITSTGGVAKRSFVFDAPVDPGLVDWAAEYLNERVVGLQLGAHAIRQRLTDPGLGQREREFLARLQPVFTEVIDSGEQRVFVGGAATLLDEAQGHELEAARRLLAAVERRAAVLELLGAAFGPRRSFIRVGDELGSEALRDVALVGATYGLANRPLGAVSLVGPLRMDYAKAIRSVRAAATELSRFVEEVYEAN
jgi:heat-inducible transcriptional repressor